VERSPVPTLYHSEGSYYSQIARLALVEKGAPWKSRLMELHGALEQARAACAWAR
jgi:glutathione S-transferase